MLAELRVEETKIHFHQILGDYLQPNIFLLDPDGRNLEFTKTLEVLLHSEEKIEIPYTQVVPLSMEKYNEAVNIILQKQIQSMNENLEQINLTARDIEDKIDSKLPCYGVQNDRAIEIYEESKRLRDSRRLKPDYLRDKVGKLCYVICLIFMKVINNTHLYR